MKTRYSECDCTFFKDYKGGTWYPTYILINEDKLYIRLRCISREVDDIIYSFVGRKEGRISSRVFEALLEGAEEMCLEQLEHYCSHKLEVFDHDDGLYHITENVLWLNT